MHILVHNYYEFCQARFNSTTDTSMHVLKMIYMIYIYFILVSRQQVNGLMLALKLPK